jgi:hypothetical protein
MMKRCEEQSTSRATGKHVCENSSSQKAVFCEAGFVRLVLSRASLSETVFGEWQSQSKLSQLKPDKPLRGKTHAPAQRAPSVLAHKSSKLRRKSLSQFPVQFSRR